MDVRMSEKELLLFTSFLECADRFLEFGSGGSTFLAASTVRAGVISVDSSIEWLARVRESCAERQTRLQPALVSVDIGATGDWGWPTDPATRNRWPLYYGLVWTEPFSAQSDLYLIDGRFRIASFMSILINTVAGSIVLFHDFASRPQYHVVRDVAEEVARAEDLSAFKIPAKIDRAKVSAILQRFGYDPS